MYVFLNIVRVNIIMKWKSNKLNAFNNLFFDFFWVDCNYISAHCSRILFTVKIIIIMLMLVTFQRRFKVWNKLKCFLLVCVKKDFITKLNQLRIFLCQFRASTRFEYFSLKMPRAFFSKAVFQPIKFCNFGL